MSEKKEKKEMSRRTFLSNVGASGAAFAIVPRHVLGHGFTPPSDTLNIAGIGVGGMGRSNLINLASQNIVALCDVDWGYADKGFDGLDTGIQNLRARIDQPNPQPASGQPPVEFDRAKAKTRLDAMIKLKTEHLPKAALLVGRRGSPARPPRQRDQGGHADGQSAAFLRRWPDRGRIHIGRRNW